MRVIIAGGRSYLITATDYVYLQGIEITEVVSGAATGADKGGETYAKWRGVGNMGGMGMKAPDDR